MTPSDLLELGKRRAEELGLHERKWGGEYGYYLSDVWKLLGAGVEIVGNVKNIDGGLTTNKCWTSISNTGETHTALAIGIKPLKVESEERKLLREFVEREKKQGAAFDLVERAKVLLEGGG